MCGWEEGNVLKPEWRGGEFRRSQFGVGGWRDGEEEALRFVGLKQGRSEFIRDG